MVTGAHAGLRSRVIAFAYDYVLIAGYLACTVALGLLVHASLPAAANTLFGDPVSAHLTGSFVLTLPVALYFILAESSARQATWGKRKQGLRVTSVDGTPVGVLRSAVRTFVKFVPWELAHACVWHLRAAPQSPPSWATWGLVLVWILVGANLLCAWLSPTRQALYDRIAGTVVVRCATATTEAPR